jgi:addiction module HigA family antidote
MSSSNIGVGLPPGPSAVLRQLIAENDLTQERLANALKVSRLTISQLVNGRRAVTAEMALRLSTAFSTTPEFWLDLQRNLDLAAAKQKLQLSLNEVEQIRVPIEDRDLFYDASLEE